MRWDGIEMVWVGCGIVGSCAYGKYERGACPYGGGMVVCILRLDIGVVFGQVYCLRTARKRYRTLQTVMRFPSLDGVFDTQCIEYGNKSLGIAYGFGPLLLLQ